MLGDLIPGFLGRGPLDWLGRETGMLAFFSLAAGLYPFSALGHHAVDHVDHHAGDLVIHHSPIQCMLRSVLVVAIMPRGHI